MSLASRSNEEIGKRFFRVDNTVPADGKYKCKACSSKMTWKKGTGWTNLASHGPPYKK